MASQKKKKNLASPSDRQYMIFKLVRQKSFIISA